MAVRKFTDEVDIIGRLSDSPVPNGDMTTQEFKDAFDTAAKRIKNYINDVLTEDVAEKIDVSGLLKGDGLGNVSLAVPGVDYQIPLGEDMVTLPMLADDVTGKLVSSTVTVELPVSGWVDKVQTVDVAGVKADNPIVVSAAPASYLAYCEAQIRATGQTAGKITFTCEDVPDAAVSAVVMIVG